MTANPFDWPEHPHIRDLRAAATLPGYHIASDGIGEEWLWKDHPTRPEQIVPKRAFRGHPDVWALLVRATGGGS